MQIPCGCEALDIHRDECRKRGRKLGEVQRPAVVAMFGELNRFWYLVHLTPTQYKQLDERGPDAAT